MFNYPLLSLWRNMDLFCGAERKTVTPEIRSGPVLRPVSVVPINLFEYITLMLWCIFYDESSITIPRVTVIQALYCVLCFIEIVK